MTKEQVLLVVQEAIKKNTDKSSMGLAYEQGFEDGANYALQKLEQCDVSGALEFGKPQMNVASLRDKMKEFFDTVTPDELIKEFELLGYEFKPIDGQANDRLTRRFAQPITTK